jgi:DNA-directed RNA polymerase specialized sigma24 family protein
LPDPKILPWCGRWRLQPADAQDVLRKLHGRMATFSSEASESFRAWLQALVHQAWRDRVAPRRRTGLGAGDSRLGGFLESLEAEDDRAPDLGMQSLKALEHVDGRDDMGSSEFLPGGPGQLVGGRACGREPSRGKAYVW